MNSPTNRPAHLGKIIAGAGLLIGVLDISDAFIFYGLHGVPLPRVLQGIASGFLGRAAFAQGHRSALLGLVLHFLIAFAVATIYLLASRRLPLSRHPLPFGTLYGVAVYVVMNYVVLPLSKVVPKPHFSPVPFVNGVAALIVCVGIPVALIARRYVPQQFT
jgi:hypothetical protein